MGAAGNDRPTHQETLMTISPRRRALRVLSLVAAGTSLPWSVSAESFPSRPIRLIIPHAPGGNSDSFGRLLAQKLSERLGQQVVTENRPGAGGTIGCAFVANAPADGYTLVVADTGTHAIAPTLYGRRLQYNVFKDFTPISLAANFSTALVIHPSVPAQTPQEFVALVKSQPGKLTYSSAGTGNGSHLALELFRTAAGGLDMVHVPYKGGAPAVQAVLSGEVQLTAVSVNTSAPHIRSGRVRGLGLASSKRSPALPDLPTFVESGIPFDAENWLAIVGPAGIPDDVVRKLNAEIAAVLHQPEIGDRLTGNGLTVVASAPERFRQVLAEDERKWGQAVKDSGAVAE
jgi:tripartite-type tricarboxylate transporter receptor subunit TctC